MKTLIINISAGRLDSCLAQTSQNKIEVERLANSFFNAVLSAADLKALTKGVNDFKRVIISFSREYFIVKLLTLPSCDRQELNGMIALQLSKITPFTKEDVTYDFIFYPDASGHSQVTLYILPKKNILPIEEFLRIVKVRHAEITFSGFGLYCWVKQQKIKLSDADNVFLLAADQNSAECAVLNRQGLLFSRFFHCLTASDLTKELNISFRLFQKEFPQIRLTRFLISGVKKPELNQPDFELAPEIIEQAAAIKFKAAAAKIFTQQQYCLVPLFGLAGLRQKPLVFDFTPGTIKENKSTSARQRRLFNLALILLEIGLLAALVVGRMYYRRLTYLSLLNNELKSAQIDQHKFELILRQLKLVKRSQNKQFMFTYILKELVESIPEDVELTYLDFANDQVFVLRGSCKDVTQAFNLAASLESNKYLKAVKVNHVSRRPDAGDPRINFQISGRFN